MFRLFQLKPPTCGKQLKRVTRAALFRFEIMRIMRVRRDFERQSFFDRYASGLKAFNLFRIVREQPNVGYAKQFQHAGGDRKIARINGKAQSGICIDGVKSLILKRLGAQFVDQADATAFLTQV